MRGVFGQLSMDVARAAHERWRNVIRMTRRASARIICARRSANSYYVVSTRSASGIQWLISSCRSWQRRFLSVTCFNALTVGRVVVHSFIFSSLPLKNLFMQYAEFGLSGYVFGRPASVTIQEYRVIRQRRRAETILAYFSSFTQ